MADTLQLTQLDYGPDNITFSQQTMLRYLIIAIATTTVFACDGAVQLCGQYACVYYENNCPNDNNCSSNRVCESAGSIRDRTPRIINELRATQRSCSTEANTQNIVAVVWDDTLTNASAAHATDMSQTGVSSFIGSDGSTTALRIQSAGATPEFFAENILSGTQTSAETINAWLDIQTDCEHMLNSTYTRIGMTCSVSASGNEGPYWSLILAGSDQ